MNNKYLDNNDLVTKNFFKTQKLFKEKKEIIKLRTNTQQQ